MKIEELKKSIENKEFDFSFQVWQLEDESSQIITNQYLEQIAKDNDLVIAYIESISDISDPGFFVDNHLYVIKEDKLEVKEKRDHVIILCNKTSYEEAIKIPKLQSWQFVDYILAVIPGINQADVEWLVTQYQTNGKINYQRLQNDLDKIKVFPESLQNSIFNELYNNGEYDTVTSLNIFDLSNAIIKKDASMVKNILKVLDYIDVSPLGLLTILLNNFRYIIGIQLNGKTTAQELGITDKQYFAIKKNNCGIYSKEQLVKIYRMLTDIEDKFKFGGLPQEMIIDYMICSILGA